MSQIDDNVKKNQKENEESLRRNADNLSEMKNDGNDNDAEKTWADQIVEEVFDSFEEEEELKPDEENTPEETQEEADPVVQLQSQVSELSDKYLRLSAEFDNYRKRTLRERMELIKSAGEDILLNILPVVDNFERALKSVESAQDIQAVKDGIVLIYNSFKEFMSQRGIKEIEAINQPFDTDVHEAITKIPAPDPALKGKVVDVILKGYQLNDKVIRFPKVVVGE